MEGIASARPISPKDNGSFVISYTCHPTMTACIWDAIVMQSLATVKFLNSQNLRAAKGSGFSVLSSEILSVLN